MQFLIIERFNLGPEVKNFAHNGVEECPLTGNLRNFYGTQNTEDIITLCFIAIN